MTIILDGTNGITTPKDVEIQGTTSGSIVIAAPAVAGSNTQTLVAVTGTLAPIVSGTAVTASGTSIDFIGIPSWAKRITVQINGLSYAAAGAGVIQIGSGSLTTTGYNTFNTSLVSAGAIAITAVTTGLGTLVTAAAASTIIGTFVLTNVTGNTWLSNGTIVKSTDLIANVVNGAITLSGVLDRLSLVATSSTFDAGTINILWE